MDKLYFNWTFSKKCHCWFDQKKLYLFTYLYGKLKSEFDISTKQKKNRYTNSAKVKELAPGHDF